jgi:predicted dehydrogenase
VQRFAHQPPEERIENAMNRRQLFQSAALAGAAASSQAKPAPGDRIGVAVIGCGGMGRMDQADFQRNPDVEIVACCDVYKPNLEKSVAMTGGKAAPYSDFRKVLERRDVDAVIIATPDHWHPLITVNACDAGKDVYVEKPVSNRLREGRLMVEAARRNQRVVQVGLQQRSGTHFQRAVKMVQSGEIGDVHYVQCWNHESGSPEGAGNPSEASAPEGLDWDFWVGPAPMRPFKKSYHPAQWRWFFDFGGGKMTDWGVHLVDIVHWGMGVDAPRSVTAIGGKLFVNDARDTPDTLSAVFEYPGFLLHYSFLLHNSFGQNGNPGHKPFGSYGIQFHGTKGTLFVDRAGYEVVAQTEGHTDPGGGSVRDMDDLTGVGQYYTARMAGGRATSSLQHFPHVRNFLDCVKSRQKPIADIESSHLATAACHLANIAYQTGRKIEWDAKSEKITNVPEANALLTRQYREPWKLNGL